MKIEKLFAKIETFYKEPSVNNEEKRLKLQELISKKIKKTKEGIKSSTNNNEIEKFNKKLEVLNKLYKKVKS
jgi:hypothetical protein